MAKGRLWCRDWKFPRDRAIGHGFEASEFDMAAEGRPSVCCESSTRSPRFSYVEDESLVVKTDVEAAVDLTSLLKKLYDQNKSWQKSPLFIVAESYGGKFAATVGLSIHKAIKAGELKLKFGGSLFSIPHLTQVEIKEE
ncbi:hypothetical protein BHE74_00047055 [Ensete ventricosum]|uniref:Uncharacterized protein n=1 Tax=Ensete ventricosum TaxID=4639 RepID=A0A426XJ60_ENSVE|nr:hypothetical protein B296_00033206 [Ensete ventricosum]RWW46988.1 hypothetical protein BHE74_00047055 [Ensete ventricosum]RZR73793.1 hypothetical protein BHM03_00028130 [Ensete ventricosum]